MFGPIRDNPLAVCDSRTVHDEDLIESNMVFLNFEDETFAVKFNPAHKWYYMSDQSPENLPLIVNSDSLARTSKCFNAAHGAELSDNYLT